MTGPDPFSIIVCLGILAFVLSVWLFMASEWGHVVAVDTAGFMFQNLLRKKRFLRWNEFGVSAARFESPLKRIVVPLQYDKLHRSLAIMVGDRPIDQDFVEALSAPAS